jgi:hypothetical protein
MCTFAQWMGREDKHDVMFMSLDGKARAGFCRHLLLGVSKVWSSKDGECVLSVLQQAVVPSQDIDAIEKSFCVGLFVMRTP